MARRMWGNDERDVYRSIVTVTYPAGWLFPDGSSRQRTEVTFHGPFVAPGPARAAATKVKRDVRTSWQFRARRNPGLEMPQVDVKIEFCELKWEPLDE